LYTNVIPLIEIIICFYGDVGHKATYCKSDTSGLVMYIINENIIHRGYHFPVIVKSLRDI